MPFTREVLELHGAGLRKRAVREKGEYGPDLAVNSGDEISEPLAKLPADR
jgi:hypothetical protein